MTFLGSFFFGGILSVVCSSASISRLFLTFPGTTAGPVSPPLRIPARVSSETRLDRALLATGFGYDVHEAETIENLEHFARFLRVARGIRRPGSAALDLAYVAAGRFDGFGIGAESVDRELAFALVAAMPHQILHD